MELDIQSYSRALFSSEYNEVSAGCVLPHPNPKPFPFTIIINPPPPDDFSKPYDVRSLFSVPFAAISKMGLAPCEVTYN